MRRAAWLVTNQSTANQTSAEMRHSLDLVHHMILSQEVIAINDMTSAHHCLQDSDKLSAGVIYPDNCQQGKRLLQEFWASEDLCHSRLHVIPYFLKIVAAATSSSTVLCPTILCNGNVLWQLL